MKIKGTLTIAIATAVLAVLSGTAAFAQDKYFFFNDTATTDIYTIAQHDGLAI